MNKIELKTYLDKMKKAELEEMILNIHSNFPRVREFISDIVRPPKIDWEDLYDTCRDEVTKASRSNKISRHAVPAAALNKFTQHGPDKELAMTYMYETFEIMVCGLLSHDYCDSFKYSFVGNYVYDCKKYMKKRKWLDSSVDKMYRKIVKKWFKPGTDNYKWIISYAGL